MSAANRTGWTDEQILLALDRSDNSGMSASAVAGEMGRMFGMHLSRNAIIGLLNRVRRDDEKVSDTCVRPENRDGGMPRGWWMREAQA